jgi:hypothetical protein
MIDRHNVKDGSPELCGRYGSSCLCFRGLVRYPGLYLKGHEVTCSYEPCMVVNQGHACMSSHNACTVTSNPSGNGSRYGA